MARKGVMMYGCLISIERYKCYRSNCYVCLCFCLSTVCVFDLLLVCRCGLI